MKSGDAVRELLRAGRALATTPGFTAAVVSTLALSIGSVTAVSSVVNTVLFEALPYDDADRLVVVWNRLDGQDGRVQNSAPSFLDYRAGARGFEGFAGISTATANLSGDGLPARVTLAAVTPDFFPMVGADARIGRVLLPEDVEAADGVAPGVATGHIVLSHGFWISRFGGRRDVVGRVLRIDGAPVEVIGVMPPGFRLHLPAETGVPSRVDGWVPMSTTQFAGLSRRVHWLTVVARLDPSTTFEQAGAQMARLAAEVRATNAYHERAGVEFEVAPLAEDLVRRARPVLLALLGAVGLLFLVGCSSVANLMLFRTAEREREIAVRLVLGSGRGRLTLSMLAESTVVAVLGCGLGVLLAVLAVEVLTSVGATYLPRLEDVTVNGRVLFVALAVSAATALGITLPPLAHLSGSDIAPVLRRAGGRSVVGNSRTRSGLVVMQLAFSFVLLVGAALMLRTVVALGSVDPGFNGRGVQTFAVTLPGSTYQLDRDATYRAFREIGDRLAALPGAESVGATSDLPLTPGNEVNAYALEEGDAEAWDRNRASYRSVLPGYFDVMDIEIVAGRPLTRQDEQYGRPVVVVDEPLAALVWGGESPLGRTLYIERFRPDQRGFQRVAAQVVGVAAPVRREGLETIGLPGIYTHLIQRARPTMTFTVAGRSGLGVPLRTVQREVATVESEAAVHDIYPMDSYVAEALAPSRAVLFVTGVFAALALTLAVVGLYGLVSYAVTARTREIGLRMALGAEGRDVLRLILAQGGVLIVAGLLTGGVLAAASSGMLDPQLYGVTPVDAVAYLLASGILAFAALGASLLPALRAIRIHPREAMTE